MLGLGEKGIAAMTVAVAAIAVGGTTIGTPLIADEINTQPDSPFYSLEKAGETIKETTYAGGLNWNLARAEERTSEFQNMVRENKAEQFEGLLNQAGNRLNKAAKKAGDANGLGHVENVITRHLERLENLRDNVPNVAKPAISLAISRSARAKAIMTQVRAQVNRKGELPENIRNQIRTQIQDMEQEMQRLRERVRENLAQARKLGHLKNRVRGLIENIELETAEELTQRVMQMARENRGKGIPPVIEEIQNRISTASTMALDNRGLNRATNATRKHLEVLENVYEKVPDTAKPAISLAIERSSRCIRILENIQENNMVGGEIPEMVRDQIRERIRELKQETEQGMKRIRERIQENKENIQDIVEEFENRAREARKRIQENLVTPGREQGENKEQAEQGGPPF